MSKSQKPGWLAREGHCSPKAPVPEEEQEGCCEALMPPRPSRGELPQSKR